MCKRHIFQDHTAFTGNGPVVFAREDRKDSPFASSLERAFQGNSSKIGARERTEPIQTARSSADVNIPILPTWGRIEDVQRWEYCFQGGSLLELWHHGLLSRPLALKELASKITVQPVKNALRMHICILRIDDRKIITFLMGNVKINTCDYLKFTKTRRKIAKRLINERAEKSASTGHYREESQIGRSDSPEGLLSRPSGLYHA